MLTQKLREIELLADFQPNVQHTPVQFNRGDFVELLRSTPGEDDWTKRQPGRGAALDRETRYNYHNSNDYRSDYAYQQLPGPMSIVQPLQVDAFNPYADFAEEQSPPKQRVAFAAAAVYEPALLQEYHNRFYKPASTGFDLGGKTTSDVEGIKPAGSLVARTVPQPVQYFDDEEDEFLADALANEAANAAGSRTEPATGAPEDAQPTRQTQKAPFQPVDARYMPLSTYTTSEQLKLLKMLKSDDSEVVPHTDEHGNVYIQVSMLRMAHSEIRRDMFQNQYEDVRFFCIPAEDVPSESEIMPKQSKTLNEWRRAKKQADVARQLEIQQKMARPYMATPRTISWLHQQLFDIFKQLSFHYVAQSNRFDDLLKMARVTRKEADPSVLQPLTPFSAFVREIYAFAKIGHIQKAETYMDELEDAASKYYAVSAAARILTLFMQYEHEYPERSSQFPHRQQDLTHEEVEQILAEQNTILPIVVYCISKLFKQTQVSRLSIDVEGLPHRFVHPPYSSAFSRVDIRLPRYFDARTLSFPISRPVLANALAEAFRAYEIPFSAYFVVAELERLQIWREDQASFVIEFFLLLENLIRVILACLNGFEGFFAPDAKTRSVKREPVSVESLLGI